MKKYMPHKLHFPSVVKELQWFTLPGIDWPDIDPHSAEYSFLKELGVCEAPNLNKLIDRITEEHQTIRSVRRERRTSYKLPIALQFFATNFREHYSRSWEKSYEKKPFLPSHLPEKSSHANVILLAPEAVFTDSNPLCPSLLPEVTNLFKNYLNILFIGIKAQPTVTQAFDTLLERKNDLLVIDWARTVFAYLSKLEGLNQKFIERLSSIAFIPTSGLLNIRTQMKYIEISLDAVTFMKPAQIFVRSNTQKSTKKASEVPKSPAFEDIDTSGLIDYVDFGSEANSFLSSVGVLPYPSIPVFAELLIDRQVSYFAHPLDNSDVLRHKIDVYTECLKQLAGTVSWTPELSREPLASRMKNEPWCLGVQSSEDKNYANVPVSSIVRPSEIYLDDDPQCARIFNPVCPPNEPTLIKLYEKFGAKWLSNCVQRESICKGK